MCDNTKFQQNRPDGFGLSQFFDFEDDRSPPSWISKFINFWSTVSRDKLPVLDHFHFRSRDRRHFV